MQTQHSLPISKARIEECIQSARFWASHIESFAQSMRNRDNYFAIISAILSALTGLGVWASLEQSRQWYVVAIVSLVSVLSTIFALISTRVKYGDCADKAASLGPRYGAVLGKLVDVLEQMQTDHANGQSFASEALQEFESIKRDKDALRPYPADLQRQRDEIKATK